jgi:hypothetical protein
VLSGAATVDQLKSNLGASAVKRDSWDPERLADVVETPEEYWGKRSRMAWN